MFAMNDVEPIRARGKKNMITGARYAGECELSQFLSLVRRFAEHDVNQHGSGPSWSAGTLFDHDLTYSPHASCRWDAPPLYGRGGSLDALCGTNLFGIGKRAIGCTITRTARLQSSARHDRLAAAVASSPSARPEIVRVSQRAESHT